MRQGPHQKRGRGRGGSNNRRPSTPNRNQTFDSNGPDVRIRGNAHQVFEKYLTLARDASTAGDRVLAESLFQHADHYFRIYSAFNEENEARKNAPQQDTGQQQPDSPPRSDDSRRDDGGDSGNVAEARSVQSPAAQPQPTSSPDDEEAPARKTRSERRQDAEAAEQTGEPEQRAPRQPRRRRNGAAAPKDAGAPAADNDAALRAMLGASESGAPKATATEDAPAASAEPEAKPVRRRGRPRKVVEAVEPALPLAGED